MPIYRGLRAFIVQRSGTAYQETGVVLVESNMTSMVSQPEQFRGNDRVLYGIILGVITFWLFAQTTLNIAPDMGRDLGLGGYAGAIIAFIRVGATLRQRFGARAPMGGGCLIRGLAVLCLAPANLLLKDYRVLAGIGYTLYGVGLAFYATPSTDAALSSLPEGRAGAGSGIYKMASSLGDAFGVAISATIFPALSSETDTARW